MGVHFTGTNEKLSLILLNAPVGLIEINSLGTITNKNRCGKLFLSQLCQAYNCSSDHIFDVLRHIDEEIIACINAFHETTGFIYTKDLLFSLQHDGNEEIKNFNISVSKVMDDCFIVGIEDNTDKYLREKAMQQADLDRAIAQGKYELASEVLHDIGNAVVGFGAYLNRVNRMLDKNKPDNLLNVATFVKNIQPQLANSIGVDKAGALATLLEGIAKNDKESKEELRRAVTEQLHIISHIQEILTIQRQYVVGHETHERKPVKLKQVIENCMSMLFASFSKKNIKVSLYIDSNSTPCIKGDRTKLMQVILNLLKNSVEAIDEEAPVKKIDIELQCIDNSIDLKITDSGKGFETEAGEEFFQRGYTTKSTGTGLGLYNCKQIIEAHEGTIQLYSDGPGKGARTHIQFHQ